MCDLRLQGVSVHSPWTTRMNRVVTSSLRGGSIMRGVRFDASSRNKKPAELDATRGFLNL